MQQLLCVFSYGMISSCSDRSMQSEVALSYYQCSSVYVSYSWTDTYGSKWVDACMNAHNKPLFSWLHEQRLIVCIHASVVSFTTIRVCSGIRNINTTTLIVWQCNFRLHGPVTAWAYHVWTKIAWAVYSALRTWNHWLCHHFSAWAWTKHFGCLSFIHSFIHSFCWWNWLWGCIIMVTL